MATAAACSMACVPAGSLGWSAGARRSTGPLPRRTVVVRSALDTKISDMGVNAPKGLFPPEPEHYRGPKLKVAIIGAGLAGMSTAVELLDQGHEVDIYESRSFIGGKVGSFVDKRGNHVEMGLHVFFGCYSNLFRLMKKVGADENLLVKDHTHTFVNKGGEIGELDFRFPLGAPLHGIRAFLSTNQLKPYDKARNAVALALSPVVRALIDPDGAMRDIRNLDNISFTDWFLSKGGTRTSIQRMWDPVAYALGFIDCDNMSARCMLTIFSLFATKTEASLLRMLKGSPDVYLSGPIRKYIMDKGGRFHLRWGCRQILYDKLPDGDTYVTGLAMSKATDKKIVQADVYIAACDVPGIKRLIPPQWREWELFENLYKLVGVPVVTVQLRYNGWVTEFQDLEKSRQSRSAVGLDNLLYTPDADFSCFADLALTSPADYFIEGQGSLIQAVLTPGDPYMPLPNEEIISRVQKQVLDIFPSSQGLEVIWSSVVKIGQSLYREAPGNDPFRPDQKTPIKNFFLAGSYTKQEIMAATVTVAAISSKLHLRSSSPSLRSSGHQATPSFRCSASSDDGKATPLLLKLAVGGVTTLLSFLSPKKSRGDPKGEAVTLARSADDVVRILLSDYERSYFLTGNFTPDIYTEDCLFEDPTISFRGKDKYSQNLELLIPFFDGPSLKLEKIEKGYNNEMNFVVAAWELSTYLKLPWRPLISIRGSTIYDLDKEFKIVRHSESWNISALDAVGQIFTFGSREGDE